VGAVDRQRAEPVIGAHETAGRSHNAHQNADSRLGIISLSRTSDLSMLLSREPGVWYRMIERILSSSWRRRRRPTGCWRRNCPPALRAGRARNRFGVRSGKRLTLRPVSSAVRAAGARWRRSPMGAVRAHSRRRDGRRTARGCVEAVGVVCPTSRPATKCEPDGQLTWRGLHGIYGGGTPLWLSPSRSYGYNVFRRGRRFSGCAPSGRLAS